MKLRRGRGTTYLLLGELNIRDSNISGMADYRIVGPVPIPH